MAPPNTTVNRVPPADQLYTILLIVATSLLFAGTIYLGVRTVQLFGSLIPPSGG